MYLEWSAHPTQFLLFKSYFWFSFYIKKKLFLISFVPALPTVFLFEVVNLQLITRHYRASLPDYLVVNEVFKDSAFNGALCSQVSNFSLLVLSPSSGYTYIHTYRGRNQDFINSTDFLKVHVSGFEKNGKEFYQVHPWSASPLIPPPTWYTYN